MKKLLLSAITVLMVTVYLLSMVYAEGIAVTLNGNKLDFSDQSPTIVESRTLVPLRAIFEALGATVEWDSSTRTVTSQRNGVTISLSIGSNILYRNGETRELDVAAQIINGRTMVPARAVAEAYDITVDWDGDTQTVILTDKASVHCFNINSIQSYTGTPFVTVNNNLPFFTAQEITTESFEKYTSLDSLGRCGMAFASIGKNIMPTSDRESIGNVKPSGWQTIKYEFIDGKYLYNRCHLIGYQLSGENANILNLITGTRYMNTEGMLPFENKVKDYIEKTNNHVLYRVTPIFENDNLLASGVVMEALSVEDNGEGICFNVFCYNVQPGVIINYKNGESKAQDGSLPYGSSQHEEIPDKNNFGFIANKNTKKFHFPNCKSVSQIKDSNKEYLSCSRDKAIDNGYEPCKNCKP